MPLVEHSSYKAPCWLPGGHAQTMYPALFRRVDGPSLTRVRIPATDGDFLDIDLLRTEESRSVAVISHGLEGNSRRGYMRGMCLAFAAQGWDCVARNFRGCGGEMNRAPGMYHSGETGDLRTVISWCLDQGYSRVFLVGFSMGGNQVLKYLGEDPNRVSANVVGATVFSVPCDLTGCSRKLDRPENTVYMRYFMRTLHQKVRQKHEQFPYLYPLEGLDKITTFHEFDGRYTAPVFGFFSAEDYWARSSSLPFLTRIRVPALLVNARNDPFLSDSCFPMETARQSSFLTLETPEQGGHVGFALSRGIYWSERRAVLFLRELL